MFEANNKTQQYKFVTLVNGTSEEAGQIYNQYMYESVMKRIADNDDFKYKVSNIPFPIP